MDATEDFQAGLAPSTYRRERDAAIADPGCTALLAALRGAARGRLLNPAYYGDDGDFHMDLVDSVAAVRAADTATAGAPVTVPLPNLADMTSDELGAWLNEVRHTTLAALEATLLGGRSTVTVDRSVVVALLWLTEREQVTAADDVATPVRLHSVG